MLTDLDDLVTLPGVGRKTANVVLNMAYGEHTMAVDTHVFRVGNRTGLALESGQGLAVPRQFFGEEFQRDGASEPRVFGQVDHAHAPATQFAEYAIAGYARWVGKRGRRHGHGSAPEDFCVQTGDSQG